MTRRRPPPVRRYLHRPWWWLSFVAAFVLADLGSNAVVAMVMAEPFADAVTVVAQASPVGSQGVLDVVFEDPGGAGQVRTSTRPSGAVTRAPDGTLTIEVSRADPYTVRVPGAYRTPGDETGFLLPLLLVPIAVWLVRVVAVRRTEREMASDGPSYAMVGTLHAPRGLHRRWRVVLFPVDANAGDAPVAAVDLIWLPWPIDGPVPIEVKGEPRPNGALAVRLGNETLWPTGRGVLRPHGVLAEAGSPAPTTVPGRPPGSAPSLWPSRALLTTSVVALVASVVIGTVNVGREQGRLADSATATATVVVADDVGAAPAIEFTDGPGRRWLVQVDGTTTAGDTLGIRYLRSNPTTVWPIDASGPNDDALESALALSTVGAAAAATAGVLARRRARAELGRWELAVNGCVDRGTTPFPAEPPPWEEVRRFRPRWWPEPPI